MDAGHTLVLLGISHHHDLLNQATGCAILPASRLSVPAACPETEQCWSCQKREFNYTRLNGQRPTLRHPKTVRLRKKRRATNIVRTWVWVKPTTFEGSIPCFETYHALSPRIQRLRHSTGPLQSGQVAAAGPVTSAMPTPHNFTRLSLGGTRFSSD